MISMLSSTGRTTRYSSQPGRWPITSFFTRMGDRPLPRMGACDKNVGAVSARVVVHGRMPPTRYMPSIVMSTADFGPRLSVRVNASERRRRSSHQRVNGCATRTHSIELVDPNIVDLLSSASATAPNSHPHSPDSARWRALIHTGQGPAVCVAWLEQSVLFRTVELSSYRLVRSLVSAVHKTSPSECRSAPPPDHPVLTTSPDFERFIGMPDRTASRHG